MQSGSGTVLTSMLLREGERSLELGSGGQRWEVELPDVECCLLVVRLAEQPDEAALPAWCAGRLETSVMLGDVSIRGATLELAMRGGPTASTSVPSGEYALTALCYSIASHSRSCCSLEVRLTPRRSIRGEASQPEDDGAPIFAGLSSLGVVLCDASRIDAAASSVGSDLLRAFTTTELGNELMQEGAIVPFMGIVPWSYRLTIAPAPGLLSASFLGTARQPVRHYRVNATREGWVAVRGEALEDWGKRREFAVAEVTWPRDDIIVSVTEWVADEDEQLGLALRSFAIEALGAYRGHALSEPWINVEPP